MILHAGVNTAGWRTVDSGDTRYYVDPEGKRYVKARAKKVGEPPVGDVEIVFSEPWRKPLVLKSAS